MDVAGCPGVQSEMMKDLQPHVALARTATDSLERGGHGKTLPGRVGRVSPNVPRGMRPRLDASSEART